MSLNKMVKPGDVKGDTTYDIILRAWLGHKLDELPDDLKNMLERWQMADRLIRHGTIATNDSGAQVTTRYNFAKLVEYLKEYFNISVRQAYDDIKNAKQFFLSCEGREDIEYARGVAIDIGDMMMFKAFDAGDFFSAAAFFKELNKIKGLHEQRFDTPNYEDFIPPTMVLIVDPTELGFEKIDNPDEVVHRIMNQKRRDAMDEVAEDTDFTEAANE